MIAPVMKAAAFARSRRPLRFRIFGLPPLEKRHLLLRRSCSPLRCSDSICIALIRNRSNIRQIFWLLSSSPSQNPSARGNRNAGNQPLHVRDLTPTHLHHRTRLIPRARHGIATTQTQRRTLDGSPQHHALLRDWTLTKKPRATVDRTSETIFDTIGCGIFGYAILSESFVKALHIVSG